MSYRNKRPRANVSIVAMVKYICESTKTVVMIETKARTIAKPKKHRWFSCVNLTTELGQPWFDTLYYLAITGKMY